MTLTDSQRARYARHLALPEIGEAGQARLLAGRVLVIGAGGLGSPAAFYLTAAGVGTISLVDADAVEPSNLQRQILHATADIGRLKVESAEEKLQALNPDVQLQVYPERFTVDSAPRLLDGYDFVVDATDNFASKFLISDACVAARIPCSHAGISKYMGQTLTVLPGASACYRCVFETPPPEVAAPQGPLGVVPGVFGAIQATEAIKYLLGIGELLLNRVLVYDALALAVRIVNVRPNPGCPCRRI